MPNSVKLGMIKLTGGILDKIREGHKLDLGLIDHLVLINQCKYVDFGIDENGFMRFRNRFCVVDFRA